MPEEWTIDTYVLYRAADFDWDAVELLNRTLRCNYRILFDHEGNIQNEYKKCLDKIRQEKKSGSEHVEKWYCHIIGKCAKLYKGRLSDIHERNLTKLESHQDDWPFMAVCSNSTDKLLVSEDSDYDEVIICYLEEEMEIKFFTIPNALRKMDIE
jgi:hypothetical protein